MRKTTLAALALLCLLLILHPAGSQAAGARLDNLSVSVVPCEDGSGMPAAAINWYQAKEDYYLFLPGGTDWEALRIWFQGNMTELEIDGKTYRNGDRISGLQDGSSFQVAVGKKKKTVHVMQGSEICALFITTQTGNLKKIEASTSVKEPGTLFLLNADGSVNYDGELTYVKTRGNTAPTLPKKNYGIKLAKGTDIQGMGKAKKWVLVGAYRDHSLLRSQIVFNMAGYVGLPYTPDCVQAEAYFNGNYYGTYLLTEKVEINNNRIDIRSLEDANKEANTEDVSSFKMVGPKKSTKGEFKAYQLASNPEDITGGYLIEYENYRQRYNYEPSAYTTMKGKIMVIKEPEYASVAEMEYISAFMQGFENAIFADDGVDPQTKKRYDEFVDFDSLVLKYMLEEVSMNVDANASSQYYFKPSDSESKVAFAGPCWDYDMSFACYSVREFQDRFLNPEAILHTKTSAGNYWWGQMYRKSEFFEGICKAWAEKYLPAMNILLGEEKDPEGRLRSVEEYRQAVEKSAVMNFTRWPIVTNHGKKNTKRTGLTFEDNITYLSQIIKTRRDYLNTKWISK